MKKVLITGGSGLVGTSLSSLLKDKGYEVAHLTRSKKDNYPYKQFVWDIKNQKMEEEAIRFADILIHLAGAGVADKRWTDERKKIIAKRLKTEQLMPFLEGYHKKQWIHRD
jgi:NAD dependent epimerase/dehydratase family enzyme